MVSILMMRMKLTVLGHSLTGLRIALMIFGVLFGLLGAAGTIWLAIVHFHASIISVDLLSLAFAGWIVGWMLGPLLSGDTMLRPEHFRLLPLSSRQLALGLLGAAFVGIGPLVTLIAFSALVVYAIHRGALAIIVALVALVLQLVCTLLLSKVLIGALNSLVKSWLSREFAAMLLGLLIALSSSGWIFYPLISNLFLTLNGHSSATFSLVMRLLPSGWGIVAVDAAGHSDWLLVLGTLLSLAVLCMLLLLLWSRELTASASGTKDNRWIRRSALLLHLLPATPTGAVIGKELRCWSRDLWRGRFLHMAVWIGLFLCGLPVLAGSLYLLPWMGVTMIPFASIPAGNVYAYDGSALWLTLVTPGSERSDVRGRQLAWLLIVAPVTMTLTIALTALSGQTWAWPWVLSIVPAMLGGAAGLMPLLSLYLLAPLTDPKRRGGSPMISGPNSGQIAVQMRLMLFFVLCTAIPTSTIILLGLWLHIPMLQWLGIFVGAGTGFLLFWIPGRMAYRKLAVSGPELFNLMYKGAPVKSTAHEKKEKAELSSGKAAMVGLLILCGILFLIPQGIVAFMLTLTDVHVRAWFVALYLPPVFRIPASIAFTISGLIAFIIAGLIIRSHLKMQREVHYIAN